MLALALGVDAQQRARRVPERLRDLVTLGDMISGSERAAQSVRDFLLTGQEPRLSPLSARRTEVDAALDALEGRGAFEPEPIAEHREAWTAIQVAAARAIEARRRTGRVVGETEQIVTVEMLPARARLQAVEERLRREANARYERAVEEADRAAARTLWVLGVGFVLGLGATVGLGLRGARESRNRRRAERERAAAVERERGARLIAEERQRLLDRVVEQSGDGVIACDAEGALRIFNAEAERQHGVSRRAVAAPDWVQTLGLLTLDERPLPLEEAALYRALQGERVTSARWLVRRPDGSTRTMIGSASPLLDESGRLEGAVLTTRDESERIRLEQERAEALAQLDALIASAPVGIALLDTELRYVRINPVLATMNGLPAEAHLGRRVAELLPGAAAELESVLRRILETGQPVIERESHLEGRHFLASFFTVQPGGAAPSGLGAVIVDTTSMKRAEEQLCRALELRERFTAILGHDLRSPLHAIHLASELLLAHARLDGPALKSVHRILSSADRMARMVAELLDVTRIRLGAGLPLDRRATDLAATCRDIVEELEAAHPEAVIDLCLTGDARGDWDPDLLAQVVSNLAGNAIQHGAPQAPVTVRLDARARDEIELSVHNRGPAISEERTSALFEPFRRGAEARSGGGLGLGLYIACQIVRAHGGALTVESSEQAGTTFRMRLPRRPPGDRDAVADTLHA